MIFFGDKRNNFQMVLDITGLIVLNNTQNQLSQTQSLKLKKEDDCHLRTHEAVWYKNIYDELFKTELPIKRWIPRTDWNGVGYDPSGRAQQVHENSV